MFRWSNINITNEYLSKAKLNDLIKAIKINDQNTIDDCDIIHPPLNTRLKPPKCASYCQY